MADLSFFCRQIWLYGSVLDPFPSSYRRQTDLVDPLLFDVALSGTDETLFATLENGDDVNPTVS